MNSEHLFLYSDGGYRQSINKGAWAFIIMNDSGEVVKSGSGEMVDSSNNICEYSGLLNGLKTAIKFTNNITCISDSQLMINQMNGSYRVKNGKLKVCKRRADILCSCFEKIEFIWMPRETPSIKACDKMCDEILGY